MISTEQALRVKYQLNKGVFVIGYLQVIEATADGAKVQVGIRKPADTLLPTGTKLYLTQNEEAANQDTIALYYMVVEGVDKRYKTPVQLCSPIHKETRPNLRKHPRKDTFFELRVKEIGEPVLEAIEGSVEGFTLRYKTTRPFIGVAQGNPCQLELPYKEGPVTVSAIVTHIHYDWQHYCHTMGAHLLGLTTKEGIIVQRLVDPTFEVGGKQKTAVNADEARIRPENL